MANANLGELFGYDQPKLFPPSPHAAMLLGSVFIRLGGYFSIDGRGQRGIGRMYQPALDEMPQLPDATPCEQFHTSDEFDGAVKLLDALIRRLDKSDRDYLFDAFAYATADDRKLVQSIEEPRRAQ